MNKSTLFLLTILSFIIGVFLWAVQYEWIVIRLPQHVVADYPTMHTKKKIDLYYWDTDRWHKESQEVLWTKQMATNLEAVITSWLALMDAERIIPKKVTVQSSMIAPSNQDAFISFDRTPFAKSWSIQKKWMLIEGLLKTVRENNIAIHTLQLLIEHQPMNDPHLDFSVPWPVNGFM